MLMLIYLDPTIIKLKQKARTVKVMTRAEVKAMMMVETVKAGIVKMAKATDRMSHCARRTGLLARGLTRTEPTRPATCEALVARALSMEMLAATVN